MSEHDVNADYQHEGDLAFSFDVNASGCLQILDYPGEKVLATLDIQQTQKLYAFLYTHHHLIVELWEKSQQ